MKSYVASDPIEVIGIDRVCLGVSVLIVWDLNDVGK